MLEKIKGMKWGYGLFALLSAVLGVLMLIFNSNMLSGLAIAIGVVVIIAAAVVVSWVNTCHQAPTKELSIHRVTEKLQGSQIWPKHLADMRIFSNKGKTYEKYANQFYL